MANEPIPGKIIRAVAVSPWSDSKGGSLPIGTQSFGVTTINGTYDGIGETEGLVNLNNQSYVMTTLDGNLKSVFLEEPNGTAIDFANVTFTFAKPPNIPLPSNPTLPVIIQFQDGTSETVNVQIQKDYPLTVLSGHSHPRAGITITQGHHLMDLSSGEGKVKLLVSLSK